MIFGPGYIEHYAVTAFSVSGIADAIALDATSVAIQPQARCVARIVIDAATILHSRRSVQYKYCNSQPIVKCPLQYFSWKISLSISECHAEYNI